MKCAKKMCPRSARIGLFCPDHAPIATTPTGRKRSQPAMQSINPKTAEGEAIKKAVRQRIVKRSVPDVDGFDRDSIGLSPDY